MKQVTEARIRSIYTGWVNGNREKAARRVCALSKLDLAYLLTHLYMVVPGIIGNTQVRVSFENFVINSLEGMYK